MSARLVLLALDGERVWAAPPGRPTDAVVVGRVVRAWRSWDAVDHTGGWLGAYRSRYAAAHAVVDHAQPTPPTARSGRVGALRRRPAELPAGGHRRAALGAVELGELLRAARLAVACGGTTGLAHRERLLAQLSHAQPAGRAQARRLARALGVAAGLAAADLAAGPAPAVLADPGGLPGRLLAARAALRPAYRRGVRPVAGQGVAAWPAQLGGAVSRGSGVAG